MHLLLNTHISTSIHYMHTHNNIHIFTAFKSHTHSIHFAFGVFFVFVFPSTSCKLCNKI